VLDAGTPTPSTRIARLGVSIAACASLGEWRNGLILHGVLNGSDTRLLWIPGCRASTFTILDSPGSSGAAMTMCSTVTFQPSRGLRVCKLQVHRRGISSTWSSHRKKSGSRSFHLQCHCSRCAFAFAAFLLFRSQRPSSQSHPVLASLVVRMAQLLLVAVCYCHCHERRQMTSSKLKQREPARQNVN
jgi:hypothetical protein